jgi:hypothetical protein
VTALLEADLAQRDRQLAVRSTSAQVDLTPVIGARGLVEERQTLRDHPVAVLVVVGDPPCTVGRRADRATPERDSAFLGRRVEAAVDLHVQRTVDGDANVAEDEGGLRRCDRAASRRAGGGEEDDEDAQWCTDHVSLHPCRPTGTVYYLRPGVAGDSSADGPGPPVRERYHERRKCVGRFALGSTRS